MGFWIVSGPSSAGKSTFLASPRCSEITGCPSPHPTVFPKDLLDGKAVPSDTWFFHYNNLRPIEIMADTNLAMHPLLRRLGGFGDLWITKKLLDKDPVPQCLNCWRDPGWEAALCLPDAPLGAVILVATAATLKSRAQNRKVVENSPFSRSADVYPSAKWARICAKVDMSAVYQLWNNELKRRGIPVAFLDATDFAFRPISEAEALGFRR